MIVLSLFSIRFNLYSYMLAPTVFMLLQLRLLTHFNIKPPFRAFLILCDMRSTERPRTRFVSQLSISSSWVSSGELRKKLLFSSTWLVSKTFISHGFRTPSPYPCGNFVVLHRLADGQVQELAGLFCSNHRSKKTPSPATEGYCTLYR